jgi:hypothetical protein
MFPIGKKKSEKILKHGISLAIIFIIVSKNILFGTKGKKTSF